MYVSDVKIEGMHNVTSKDYSFNSGATYIVGPNGSGKSTIMQAIQLALLGYVPGTSKTAQGIFSHCNSNEMNVRVTLKHNEDTIEISRGFYKEGSKVSSVDPEIIITSDAGNTYELDDIIGDFELPIFNFNEFLALTANKQKDALISILPESNEPLDVRKYLSGNLPRGYKQPTELIDEIVEEYPVVEGIEQLKALHVYVKELQSLKNAEEKRLSGTIQSLVVYDDFDDSIYTSIEEVDAQISELRELLETKIKHSNCENELNQLSFQMHDAVDDIDKVEKSCREIEDKLADIQDQIRAKERNKLEIVAKKASLEAQTKNYSDFVNSEGICPLLGVKCKDDMTSVQDSLKNLSSELEQYDGKIYLVNSSIESLESSKRDVEKQLRSIQQSIQTYYTLKSRYDALVEEFESMDDGSTSIEELRKKISELEDIKMKLVANKKFEELNDKLIADHNQLLTDIDCIKLWVKCLGENGLQTAWVQKPFEELRKTLCNILQSMGLSNFGNPNFVLTEKVNSFNFGVTRGDTFISFNQLSSGEKCVFTIAMISAIVLNTNSLLNSVLVDDLFDHLDESRFVSVMEELPKLTDIQFIIAGVNTLDVSKYDVEVIRLK